MCLLKVRTNPSIIAIDSKQCLLNASTKPASEPAFFMHKSKQPCDCIIRFIAYNSENLVLIIQVAIKGKGASNGSIVQRVYQAGFFWKHRRAQEEGRQVL